MHFWKKVATAIGFKWVKAAKHSSAVTSMEQQVADTRLKESIAFHAKLEAHFVNHPEDRKKLEDLKAEVARMMDAIRKEAEISDQRAVGKNTPDLHKVLEPAGV